MNLHFSYKNCQATPDVVKLIERHVQKLEKLLRVYAPELVHLKGSLAQQASKAGESFEASINLRLPTGQVHGREAAGDAVGCLRIAFDELERQIKQHKELLRKEAGWKRKRPRLP